MLNLINILTLSTALTTQPITNTINIKVQDGGELVYYNTTSTLERESKYRHSFNILLYEDTTPTRSIKLSYI